MIHGIGTRFLVHVEVREVPRHEAARGWLDEALARHPQPLALAPQVLSEFIPVVTDPRRFASPLGMDEALVKAQGWREASERGETDLPLAGFDSLGFFMASPASPWAQTPARHSTRCNILRGRRDPPADAGYGRF